jgi:peptide-methionine (S)-S-oxide reductase
MTLRAFVLVPVAALACVAARATDGPVPSPRLDAPLAAAPGERKAVLAGGCFWGIQAVFQHVRGVTQAVSGYSGGSAWNAHYEVVSLGVTAHAESVEVTYDPARITYGQLLRVFFSVAHDPTQVNRQGPDTGRQYRSAIFFADAEQKRIAEAYIAQLGAARVFPRPLATEVVPLEAFYVAESYHQDYAARHPESLYIQVNDAPKVVRLKVEFPGLYREGPQALGLHSPAKGSPTVFSMRRSGTSQISATRMNRAHEALGSTQARGTAGA